MCGGRAVVELMYCDFLGRAGDEVFNQMSKWQAMSAGILKMPMILRMSVGAKYGAQHSQDWVAIVSHIPGLKVFFPATPYEAKGIMQAALNGTDPCVIFESQRIYGKGEEFHEGGVPAEEYEWAPGAVNKVRDGKDLTILTIGATLYRAVDAAKTLSEKYGHRGRRHQYAVACPAGLYRPHRVRQEDRPCRPGLRRLRKRHVPQRDRGESDEYVLRII